MSAVIQADRLSKWYGEVLGVQDVSTAFEPGITALVGPNGSGKSTLLRLATGQIRPSQGTLRIEGKDPWRDRSVLKRIGYAPEGEGGPGRSTPLEWVSDLALLSGIPGNAAQGASERALALARLSVEAWRRPLGTLSNGMRQKAKLAQAAVHDPAILVLDEPFSGVDPASRTDLIASIRQVAEAGRTVILSSHNLSDVARLTDRIALLHRGRMLAAGHVPEIRRLLDRYPFRIRIDTDDPRKLAAAFIHRPEIQKIGIPSEKALILETNQCESIMNDLSAILSSTSVAIHGFHQEDEDIESVFEYLTDGVRGAPWSRSP